MNDRTNLQTKTIFILKPGFSIDNQKLPVASKCMFGTQTQKVKITGNTLLRIPFAFKFSYVPPYQEVEKGHNIR